MICAGCVRQKNVQNTLLKNLLDVSSSSVTFFAIGYAFAFGSTDDGSISKTFAFGSTDDDSNSKTFVGTSNFFLVGVDNLSFWFFQYVFSATAGKSCIVAAKHDSCMRNLTSKISMCST